MKKDPITDLIKLEDWAPLSNSEWGPLTLLDAAFHPVLSENMPAPLCEKAVADGKCAICPLAGATPARDFLMLEFTCAAGIRGCLAAVRVRGETFGYVCGPALAAPEESAGWVEGIERGSEPAHDAAGLASRVRSAAFEVGGRCRRARDRRIVDEACQKLNHADKEPAIRKLVLDATVELYPATDVVIYASNGPHLSLVGAAGPNRANMPDPLPLDTGHVGWVIRYSQSWSVPDMELDAVAAQRFVPPIGAPTTKSAITVPLRWGLSLEPAALQVFSDRRRWFDRDDQEELETLALAADGAFARLAAPQQNSELTENTAAAANGKDPFADLREKAKEADKPWHILALKRQALDLFVGEALRRALARSAGVRRWDDKERVLRFIAFAGDGWTTTNKDIEYRSGAPSIGMLAFHTDSPQYVPLIGPAVEFHSIFSFTKSVCALPWHVRGKPAGVLTVDWGQPSCGTGDILASLTELVKMFDDTLAYFTSQEEQLLGRLVDEVFGALGLESVLQEAVNWAKQHLGSRSCSLFLRYPDTETLRLAATTIPPEKRGAIPEYQIGGGLTGWVAAQNRALRLRNVEDRVALSRINPTPEWKKVWEEPIDTSGADGHLTFLAAPLSKGTEAIGVIRAWLKEDAGEFEPPDRLILELLTDNLAKLVRTVWSRLERQGLPARPAYQEEAGLSPLCHVLAHDMLSRTGSIGATGAAVLVSAAGDWDSVWFGGAGALESGSPEVYETLRAAQKEPQPFPQPAQDSASPYLVTALPIHMSGQPGPIGALGLACNGPINEECDNELREFAKLAGGILGPARKWSEGMQRLHRMAGALTATADLPAVLDNILGAALEESHFDTGTIRLWDRDREVWTMAAADNSEATVGDLASNAVLARVQNAEHPLLISDTANDAVWREHARTAPPAEKHYLDDIRTSLHAPIRVANACVGAILLDSRKQLDVGPECLEFIELLCVYAGMAIVVHRTQESRLQLAEPFALLGALIGGFLHEFRSQINNGFAVLNTVADGVDVARLPEEMEALRDCLRRLRQVSAELADFARRRPSGPMACLSLNETVSRVLTNIGSQHRRGICFEQQLDPGDPFIRASLIEIEVAMKMVIQNAVEAMGGTGRLTVETQVTDVVAVRFRDTGCGMDEDTLARCLAGFFSTKEYGTGLGIRIIQGIMNRHGGRLEVESEKGQGTTVSLIFPVPMEQTCQAC